jgi:hypothetical protein
VCSPGSTGSGTLFPRDRDHDLVAVALHDEIAQRLADRDDEVMDLRFHTGCGFFRRRHTRGLSSLLRASPAAERYHVQALAHFFCFSKQAARLICVPGEGSALLLPAKASHATAKSLRFHRSETFLEELLRRCLVGEGETWRHASEAQKRAYDEAANLRAHARVITRPAVARQRFGSIDGPLFGFAGSVFGCGGGTIGGVSALTVVGA